MRCRNDATDFENYVASAHNQFPVSSLLDTQKPDLNLLQQYNIVVTEFALQNPPGGATDQ